MNYHNPVEKQVRAAAEWKATQKIVEQHASILNRPNFIEIILSSDMLNFCWHDKKSRLGYKNSLLYE